MANELFPKRAIRGHAASKDRERAFLHREPFDMMKTVEVEPRRGFRYVFGMPMEALRGVPGRATLHDALIREAQRTSLRLSPLGTFIQAAFGKDSPFGPQVTFQQQVRSICVLVTLLESVLDRFGDSIIRHENDVPDDGDGDSKHATASAGK